MDRLEGMAVFIAVVEAGSFSAASRALRMPLASVSRRIADLEAHLGTQLLTRTTRKLALTDTGSAYLTAARQILDQIREAERAAAGEFSTPRGELIVTAPVLFGRLHILPIVTAFLATYPDINVRLMLSDRNLHLIDDHVDVAARIGMLPDSSFVAQRVGAMRTVVCASPAFLDRHGPITVPTDIAGLPAISFYQSSPQPTWSFRQAGSATRQTIAIRPRLAVTHAEAAVSAAVDGVGLARLFLYQCARERADGTLRLVLEDVEPPPQPVHILHLPRDTLPTKTRVFVDFAAQRLRDRLRTLDAASNP
jgi:DNA-binding transcriptional LysR family regulator